MCLKADPVSRPDMPSSVPPPQESGPHCDSFGRKCGLVRPFSAKPGYCCGVWPHRVRGQEKEDKMQAVGGPLGTRYWGRQPKWKTLTDTHLPLSFLSLRSNSRSQYTFQFTFFFLTVKTAYHLESALFLKIKLIIHTGKLLKLLISQQSRR